MLIICTFLRPDEFSLLLLLLLLLLKVVLFLSKVLLLPANNYLTRQNTDFIFLSYTPSPPDSQSLI